MSNNQSHRKRDNTTKPEPRGKGKAREENPAGHSWGASEDTQEALQVPTGSLPAPTHVGRQHKKKKNRLTQAQQQQREREREREDAFDDDQLDDSIIKDLGGVPNPHAANLQHLLNVPETDDTESLTTLPAQSDNTTEELVPPQQSAARHLEPPSREDNSSNTSSCSTK